MVGALLSLPEPPEPDHAADALAVAICHANGAAAEGGARVTGHDRLGPRRGHRRCAGEVVIEAAASATASRSRPRRSPVPRGRREALLHTHLIMRDDGMHLYGFATEDERELFLMLIGVQASARRWRSPCSRAARRASCSNAIAAGDAARFQAVPGIGKRTAERDHRRAAREGRPAR